MINYILVSNWWKFLLTDTVTLSSGGFDNDHSLLISSIFVRLKLFLNQSKNFQDSVWKP